MGSFESHMLQRIDLQKPQCLCGFAGVYCLSNCSSEHGSEHYFCTYSDCTFFESFHRIDNARFLVDSAPIFVIKVFCNLNTGMAHLTLNEL